MPEQPAELVEAPGDLPSLRALLAKACAAVVNGRMSAGTAHALAAVAGRLAQALAVDARASSFDAAEQREREELAGMLRELGLQPPPGGDLH